MGRDLVQHLRKPGVPGRGGWPASAARRGHLAALIAVLVGLLAGAPLAVADVGPPWRTPLPRGYEEATIEVGGVELRVELARTGEEQTLGLSYRDGLAPGTGMLFVYDEPGHHAFWMRGMRFCLDIVWIEGGRIVGAAERFCPSPPDTPLADLPRVSPPEPVSFVLEVPAGWLERHGFGAGTPVTIPDEVREGA